jgi:gliding motility-associated-like protein
MKNLLSFIFILCSIQVFGQLQTCPININYSNGNFTHWFGFTGVYQNKTSRQHLDIINYDSTSSLPTGTVNAISITEYGSSAAGIEVVTNNSADPFGSFETIPTINGYSYNYSMKIGSTYINTAANGVLQDPSLGGLFRGLGYTINVPAGPVNVPYVVTYAYAMVLESAPHDNDQVPMFTAKLNTQNGIIDCASAVYLLPTTFNGTAYVLDQKGALQEGFTLSGVPSPNNNGNNNENPYRVWTKGWTEVIFDLAPYRGQQVTLTFEADNCVPKGHFAYAYVALKNVCEGLEIGGTTVGCTNANLTYAIPELKGANYEWTIPNGWKYVKDSLNTITVRPDTSAGTIVARAINSCADLKANITVTISPPTIPGTITGDSTVCKGLIPNQNFPLGLVGNRGSILTWQSSADNGRIWVDLRDTSSVHIAKNLSSSTLFRAVVQNGSICSIDTTAAAIITINPKPIAGTISPDNIQICLDQPLLNALTLNGSSGTLYNWQSSIDQINWTNTIPVNKDTIQGVSGIKGKTYFRAIVSTPTCPSDTSNKVSIGIYNVHYPKAVIPRDTTICFGTAADLSATILIGTNYQWVNPNSIFNVGNGVVEGTPYLIHARSAPSKKTDYILSITNAGCPNILYDTIHVNVLSALNINAGNDTTILMNQPLQLNAKLSDGRRVNYLWTPANGLSSSIISNPIAVLDGNPEYMRFTVSAIDSIGCSISDNILVRVIKSGPEIYVPTGFTPNADGRNDVLKPTVYGITQQYYFSVYNRWGQQIFFTTVLGKGWDGFWNGVAQPSGAYVFVAEGVDFLGKRITRTGTAVLIR